MKFNKKASVPIGTIAIIIIVLIASIGMYWYFTQDGALDCSDVKKKDTPDVYIYTIVSETDNIPLIQHWKRCTNLCVRMWYETPGGAAMDTYFVDTLDELEDALSGLNIDSKDRKQAQLIIDCIRADCPNCVEG